MPKVIITIPEKDAQPYRFQLDSFVVSLGRGSENDIVIDDGSVSSSHAQMRRVEGGYELIDSGSTNGIKRNGTRMDAVSLRSGMDLKIGDVLFYFELTAEEQRVISEEVPQREEPPAQGRSLPRPPSRPAAVGQQGGRDQYRPPARRPAQHTMSSDSSGMGFGSIVLFLFFTGLAFFGGLYIRYNKETGGSLFTGIENKWNGKEAAPVEGDASVEAAAE